MDIDRDALFAALALRAGRIDSGRLAAAYEGLQKSTLPLSELLVRRGDLGPEQCHEVQARLDMLLRQYPDDPHALWLAAADDQVRSVMTALSLPPFQPTIGPVAIGEEPAATIDVGAPGQLMAETVASGPDTSAPGSATAATIDAQGGGGGGDEGIEGLSLSTIDSKEVGTIVGRFVERQPLGVGSGEHPTNRYSRTRLHAQGGLGEIWRARDEVLGREVALKELKIRDPRHRALLWDRFVAEARVTGQLEHPNIVPVHELGRHPEDGRPFYTMRFVRGRTLAEEITAYRRGRNAGRDDAMGLRRLLDVFIDVCNAVAFAHSRGVIHRDLKGQNVVLGDYGEALVIDWGLARPASGRDLAAGRPGGEGEGEGDGEAGPVVAFDPARAETQVGQILGTPAYMPPEQARGEIEKLGPASDIYSLGAMLFELLTGRPPHVGAAGTDLLRLAREGSPPEPRSVDPTAPKALEAICLKALRREPSDRYPTATALAEDVRRWLADEPVGVYREPMTVRASRWARRHRTGVAAAAAVVAASVPILATSAALIGRERDRAAAMEGVARSAVEDMYLDVADAVLGDLSDPRQEDFLRRALARLEGPDAGDGASAPANDDTTGPAAPPIDDAMRGPMGEALAYYEGFARGGGIGPDAALDAARAWTRIGDITARLGRFDEAEDAYRRAEAGLEPPADDGRGPAEARRRLAEARAHHGALLAVLGRSDEAKPLLRSAIDAREALLDDDPGREDDALALASAQADLAELQKLVGRYDQAEASYRSAIDRLGPMADAPDAGVPARRELAAADDGLGVLMLMLGRSDEAGPLLRRAIGVQEALVAGLPTVPRLREGLAETSNSLGLLLRRDGKPEEAEAMLRAALAHFERLVGDFPGRVEYRRFLAGASMNLGVLLHVEGRSAEAEAPLREAVSQYEGLATDAPEAMKVRRDLVHARLDLGAVLERLGRFDEAAEHDRRAVAEAEPLVGRFPKVPELRHDLASALINLGGILGLLGDPAAAEEGLDRARTLLDRLVAEAPDRPAFAQTLASCEAAIGLVLLQAGRPEEAEASFAAATDRFEALLRDRPDDRDLMTGLATCLTNRANLKNDAAGPSLRRALELYRALAGGRDDPGPALTQNLGIVHYNLGEHLVESGQQEDGEREYAEGARLLADAAGGPGGTAETMSMAAVAAKDYATRALAARGAFDEAIAQLEQAVALMTDAAVEAGDTTYLPSLFEVVSAQVEVLLAAGRYLDAAGAATSLADAVPGQLALRSRSAVLLARCIEAIRGDSGLDPDRAESLERDLGDRAVAQVRVALDAGYNPESLRKLDDQFGPLHDRDDFKELLAPAVEDGSGAEE